MNRSRNFNKSQGSYSSSRSGLPNSTNRNFNNLDRDDAYRSDHQPRYGAGFQSQGQDHERYDEVNYGREHEDENQNNSVNSYRSQHNPQAGGSQWGRGREQHYGNADRYGGNENYADRGYSEQAGGWGDGRDQNQQRYPSTSGSRDSYSQPWQGNPSPNSAYGAEWNSLTTESHAGRGPKNYRRSDERIHEDVSEALTHAHQIDASEIEVEVKEGIVTLSGSVSDKKTKRAAEECIENLSGVKDVKNNLSVTSSGFFSNLMGKDEDKSIKKPSPSANKLQ